MRLSDDALTIFHVRYGPEHDNAFGIWREGRWYCSFVCAQNISCCFRNIALLYARGTGEADGDRCLGDIATHIFHMDEADWLFVLNTVVPFACSYDRYYACDDCTYWVHDIHFDVQMGSSGCFVLPWWQDVEAFALLPKERDNFYISRSSWWSPYQRCRFLSMLPTPKFAFYLSFVIDNEVNASRIRRLVLTEYFVLAVNWLLRVVRIGAVEYQRADFGL